MDRREFEYLRDLKGKYITDDIVFKPDRGFGPNLIFRDILVHNDLGIKLILNGTFKPLLNAVSYNFVVSGIGPICRTDVNGTIHKNAGRTHKQELTKPEDPAHNLPNAIARPDLIGKSAKEVWEILCKQADIEHLGKFVEP